MNLFVDTHAHLHEDRFDADREAVVRRAVDAGVTQILTNGIDAESSRAAVELAAKYAPHVFAVVGIQPNHVAEMKDGDWETIVKLATAPRVVAIGESGLDRYWDRAPFPLQEEYFRKHLQLCRETKKPIVIHNREADADVVQLLRSEFERHGPVPGVMHSFAGAAETAVACLELGMHISFAGMVTYKTAEDLRKIAATIPADRILVETDCPYLAPQPVRGKRNEPAYVIHTAECVAKARSESLETLARNSTANARKLFGISD